VHIFRPLPVAKLRDDPHRTPCCRAPTIHSMKIDTDAQDQAIQQLKQDWDQLSDPDRALAIAKIKTSGLSNRKIASLLGHSESLVRRLLLILDAPVADRIAARKGKITTNELIRRTHTARQRKAAQQQKNAQQVRKQKAYVGARLIGGWLQKHRLTGSYGEQIVEEARRMMIAALFDGSLPHVDPPDHPVPPAVIIERCKPKEPLTDDIDPSGWYSLWLARWIVFAFPDPDVRDQALDITLEHL
jgi:hypothetical protein